MKATLLFFALLSLAMPASAQSLNSKRHMWEPLSLYINGPGHVLHLHDGQMLEVGHSYTMAAVANRGHRFTGWTEVGIYTSMEGFYDDANDFIATSTNLVYSFPIHQFRKASLTFNMQASQITDVTFNGSNVQMTKISFGWMANFSE